MQLSQSRTCAGVAGLHKNLPAVLKSGRKLPIIQYRQQFLRWDSCEAELRSRAGLSRGADNRDPDKVGRDGFHGSQAQWRPRLFQDKDIVWL